MPPVFQHFYALQEKQMEKLNCSVNTAIALFPDVMEPALISKTHMNVFPLLAKFLCQSAAAYLMPDLRSWCSFAAMLTCSEKLIEHVEDES